MTSPDPLGLTEFEEFVRVGFYQQYGACFDHAVWCGETSYEWPQCPRVDRHLAEGDQCAAAIAEDMARQADA